MGAGGGPSREETHWLKTVSEFGSGGATGIPQLASAQM